MSKNELSLLVLLLGILVRVWSSDMTNVIVHSSYNKIINEINTVLCPIKVKSNTIELTVRTYFYFVCTFPVNIFTWREYICTECHSAYVTTELCN